MKSIILENGIKLIYKKTTSALTSFCIGFNAGAQREDDDITGAAHAVEHMLFKGTKTRTENEINNKCDEIFAFNNAMTNFPYVIYYAVCDNDDFKDGFELYSDIVVNPLINYAIDEELNVIKTESSEWKEDAEQYCEDELFYNTFSTRRMRKTIIGDVSDIERLTEQKLKDFYNKYYCGANCTVSVVSSLDFDMVRNTVEDFMGIMKMGKKEDNNFDYEFSNPGYHEKEIIGLTGAKIEYCFDISSLSDEEIEMMNIFSHYFGEGVSSVLYDNLRTKNGYVYDASSRVSDESGIKLFKIMAGSSKENINKVKNIIDSLIQDCIDGRLRVEDDHRKKLYKRIVRKRNMDVERSIIMAVRLVECDIMYGSYDRVIRGLNGSYNMSDVNNIASKILKRPSIQVLK